MTFWNRARLGALPFLINVRRRKVDWHKIALCLSFFASLLSCTGPGDRLSLEKVDMLKIAKQKRCSSYFQDVYTLDSCIYLMTPFFDSLLASDREEVVVSFVLYSDLQGGAFTAFSELIDPYKKELTAHLSNYSDEQLTKKYSLSARQTDRYRQKLTQLLALDTPRGSH